MFNSSTTDILKFTKKVRNWRNLCDGLDIRYHKITEIVQLNSHIGKATDDSYLEAVIIAFLRGEGSYQPTWRAVIHALLYESNGPYLALSETLRSFSKGPKGDCIILYIVHRFFGNVYNNNIILTEFLPWGGEWGFQYTD